MFDFFKKSDWEKYRIWFYLVVVFSALPVIINILWDFTNSEGDFWKGIRLIDFLICGFCLVGGALCDRLNSNFVLSKDALCGSILLSLGALGIYCLAKSSSPPADASGLYARDNFLIGLIVFIYFMSLIFSMVIMRKSYRKG